ncbi:MAG: DUF3568 family protein [Lentisphaeria bacterium]|nr:DUF3568 domain-containing protein [Lentisphaeria bacterium]NQZ68465.1 DUF3568 family protein [Lentisphaeria bacterium]
MKKITILLLIIFITGCRSKDVEIIEWKLTKYEIFLVVTKHDLKRTFNSEFLTTMDVVEIAVRKMPVHTVHSFQGLETAVISATTNENKVIKIILKILDKKTTEYFIRVDKGNEKVSKQVTDIIEQELKTRL